MKELRLAALLPLLVLSGLLVATSGTTAASDDAPVVRILVTPHR